MKAFERNWVFERIPYMHVRRISVSQLQVPFIIIRHDLKLESQHRKLQHKEKIHWSTLRATYDHFEGHCSKGSFINLKVRCYTFEVFVIILILLSVILFQLTLITQNNI